MKKFKSLQSWQKKKLIFWFLLVVGIAALFLGLTGYSLWKDKQQENKYWDYFLHEAETYTPEEQQLVDHALNVGIGMNLENIDTINIKDSYFEVSFKCWFNWADDTVTTMLDKFEIYKGTINSISVIDQNHEAGQHYQLFKVKARINKSFWTKRFPLASYQLRIYLKPTVPVSEMVFVPDTQNSVITDTLTIPGFDISRYAFGQCIIREDAKANGAYHKEDGTTSYSEFLTQLELNRNSLGTYIKCIIALIGTSIWVFMTLFVCASHQVDTLGMIPAILFGTVTNIMVGANMVSEAMDTGLLEYINLWGIYTILIVTTIIINVNSIRKYHNDTRFAASFGRIMFFTAMITTVIGHIVLPLAAYKFY